MVKFRPFFGAVEVDWEKTADSKQKITHNWSMMVTTDKLCTQPSSSSVELLFLHESAKTSRQDFPIIR